MSCWLMALAVVLGGQLGARYEGQGDSTEAPAENSTQAEAKPTEGGELGANSPTSEETGKQNEGEVAEQDTADIDASPLDLLKEESTPPANDDAGEASLQPSSEVATAADPTLLLESCFDPPLRGALNGSRIALTEVLAGARSRAEQTERVEAYWELAFAVAQYYVTLDERTEFAALRQAVAKPSELWDRASQALEARQRLEFSHVQLCQRNLANLLINRETDFAPLPADLPFCGVYDTKYEVIFQNSPSPLGESFSQYIPQAFKAIQQAADEVGLAKKWVYSTSLRRSPQSDGAELLLAFEGYANTRRQFLTVAKDYNLQIVRYTELASPQALDSEQLASMLIRRPVSTTVDPNVQNANAEQEIDRGDATGQAPGSSNWSVPSGRERSILVPGRS